MDGSDDVTDNYIVIKENWGSVTINPKPITVSSNSNTLVYNGDNQGDDPWNTLSVDGLCPDAKHDVIIKKYPTLKDVSDSGIKNNVFTYKIMDGSDDVTDNYIVIEENWGSVTITPREVKIKTHSYRWGDVQKHSYEGYDYDGYSLGKDDWLVLTYTTYIDAYGSKPNKLEFSVRGLNKDGVEVDMTENYDLEVVEYGTLIIAKPISIYLYPTSLQYGGTEKRIEIDRMVLNNESDKALNFRLIAIDKTLINANETITSDMLSGLDTSVRFAVYDENGNDVTELYYVVVEKPDAPQEVYEVLKITPKRLVIKVKDCTLEYTGEELTSQQYTTSGGTSLASGHKFDPNNKKLIEGSATEVGETATIEIRKEKWGEFKILDEDGNLVQQGPNGNYEITFLSGTLEVIDPN